MLCQRVSRRGSADRSRLGSNPAAFGTAFEENFRVSCHPAVSGLHDTARELNPSLPSKVDEHNVRTFLHPFQDNFTAVWGNVEVPSVEIAWHVGQLPLSAGLRVH